MPVFVNGRFLTQRVTGVQRYARHLLAALDAHMAAAPPGSDWVLLLPAGADAPPLRAIGRRWVDWRGPGGSHGWEQFALPLAARRGLLLSLSGAAPAWPRRQACVLHDAAVFDHPEAYAPKFRLWYRWLFRRLAQRAALPVTVSSYSRARLAAMTGVAPSRFAVVPGGADHLAEVGADAMALERLGLTGTRFLLAVGSLNPTKNLAALVRAWVRLGRRDARLVVVGAANPRVFSGRAPAAADGVEWVGAVDDETLVALYGAADGLVFPSLYEGFGLPPLEAMTAGCPVAAARAAALPEVCGDAALWFDPSDDAAIRAAIVRLLDDADLRADLRRRGRGQAAAHTWERSAKELLSALDAVGVGR